MAKEQLSPEQPTDTTPWFLAGGAVPAVVYSEGKLLTWPYENRANPGTYGAVPGNDDGWQWAGTLEPAR